MPFLSQDCHSSYKSESQENVVGRFNERFVWQQFNFLATSSFYESDCCLTFILIKKSINDVLYQFPNKEKTVHIRSLKKKKTVHTRIFSIYLFITKTSLVML